MNSPKPKPSRKQRKCPEHLRISSPVSSPSPGRSLLCARRAQRRPARRCWRTRAASKPMWCPAVFVLARPDLQASGPSTYVPLERRARNMSSTPRVRRWRAEEPAARESEHTERAPCPTSHYDFTQFGLDRSQSHVCAQLARAPRRSPTTNSSLTPMGRSAAERAASERRGRQYDAVENMRDRSRASSCAQTAEMNAGYKPIPVVQPPRVGLRSHPR